MALAPQSFAPLDTGLGPVPNGCGARPSSQEQYGLHALSSLYLLSYSQPAYRVTRTRVARAFWLGVLLLPIMPDLPLGARPLVARALKVNFLPYFCA